MGDIPVSCFVYYVVMNRITLCPQNFPDAVFAPALEPSFMMTLTRTKITPVLVIETINSQ